MIASGLARTTASRSASVRPVCKPFTRTRRYGRGVVATVSRRKAAALSRARALPSYAIESSRSTISASAPLVIAFSSFLALSAGTKRNERIGNPSRAPFRSREAAERNSRSRRPHAHEGLAAALRDQLVVLVVGAVMKLDDAGAGPRLRFALTDDFGSRVHGVAFEKRMGEFHLGHPEIRDRGAHGKGADRHADHQAKREQRIHQRLSPFGLLLAEMPVDMERLRVERHVGEQHVVHLGDGARIAVLDQLAGHETLEIEAAALVPHGCLLRHSRLLLVKFPFTIIV